jgi:hypothetical protein
MIVYRNLDLMFSLGISAITTTIAIDPCIYHTL